jgi:cytochrome c5
MPPKGGRLDLSDDEIYGAVDYMVSEAQGNQ